MLSRLVISDSLQTHELKPTRLLCPWNFPGKNTGVVCHFLLQRVLLQWTQGLKSLASSALAGQFLYNWATWEATKWTGMGKFNSDDHYIYHSGQESLRRSGVALIINRRVPHKRQINKILACNLKNDRMISVLFQGKPFNITVIQVYAPTTKAEEAKLTSSV